MIIYHHLGLGDHIICNGLVRTYASVYSGKYVTVLSKKNNFHNVTRMYRDAKNILVMPIDDYLDAKIYCNFMRAQKKQILTCGFCTNNKKHDCLWDESFYRDANIDFDSSFDKFYIERDTYKEYNLMQNLGILKKPYCFIHNIDSTGIDRINYSYINKYMITIYPHKNINFFDYCLLIEKATEIHCVDSSFKHLAERLNTTGKLFYHKIKNPKYFDKHTTKKKWIEV